ncbi:Imm53 family immunity protein [Peribacillus sp. SCS-155]|uniref:Imm53 family immunity protein n=1 Tax=Peribacillus sedimenti TaxID=3115297 RepID=UPI003905D949
MEALQWLQKWYLEECNGDWELEFGIRITTLDNPGWCSSICLEEIILEDKVFQSMDCHARNTVDPMQVETCTTTG